MTRKRRTFSADFKAQVALTAIKNQSTAAEICNQYSVTTSQISKWKGELIKNASHLFVNRCSSISKEVLENEKSPLFEEIGRLKIEVDWLKKKSLQLDLMRKLK